MNENMMQLGKMRRKPSMVHIFVANLLPLHAQDPAPTEYQIILHLKHPSLDTLAVKVVETFYFGAVYIQCIVQATNHAQVCCASLQKVHT